MALIDKPRKCGPLATPGGATGGANSDHAPQTITAVPQMIGPLTAEHSYSFEGDVDMYLLQGTVAKLKPGGTLLDNAGLIAAGARRVPANTELEFDIGANDGYFMWARIGGSDGSNFRCNDTTQAYSS